MSTARYSCARLLLIAMTTQNINFAKAENTYENGGGCRGGGGGVLGLFSGVINKVCGEQRGTESL